MLWTFIVILALILVSGFFSGSETAVTGASRPRVVQLEKQGDRRAGVLAKLWSQSDTLISTILVGNNLVNILATALVTAVLTQIFPIWGALLATLFMTIIVVIFAEVLPKTIAFRHADAIALAVAPMLRFLVTVLRPATFAVSLVVRGVIALVGQKQDQSEEETRRAEELRGSIELLASNERDALDDDDVAERTMLRSILDLEDITIEEVMTHRGKVETLDIETPAEELVNQVMKSQHTRLPVWQDNPDNIVGVLHAKNVLRALGDHDGEASKLDVKAIMSKAWFVPETAQLDEQLRAFRKRRAHFAVVVDEYGSLMGIITLEDILEEIVGDIADEHDFMMERIRRGRDGSYVSDGAMTIRDLNRLFGWLLPDERATTIAGLVLYESRQIPKTGQVFVFHNFRFEIMEMDRLQITKLRLTPLSH